MREAVSKKQSCSVMVSTLGYRFRKVSRWEREFWRLEEKEKKLREELKRLGFIERRRIIV